MLAKIHWNLLILFGFLCQGIIGALSERNIDQSSELLLRQKRVIHRGPGGDQKEMIKNVPYVVSVKRFRSEHSCVGAILTHHIVLTAAKCLDFEITKIKVYSGSVDAIMPSLSHAVNHNATDKKVFAGNHPFRPEDGIGLVTVNPAFIYSINTQNIQFYQGPIHGGQYGTVTGWGCNPRGYSGTAHPHRLRSITVPIISNHECTMLYLHTLPITESDICTLDVTGNRYCGDTDVGAPLVIEVQYEKYLAGIYLWNGAVVGRINPDVFINLQSPMYKNWIRENIPIMEARVNHR